MKYLVFSLVVFLVGCGGGDPGDRNNVNSNSVAVSIVDYGNGVFYINATSANFANALSSFLSTRSCRVEAVTGNGTGTYGVDKGYFVICR